MKVPSQIFRWFEKMKSNYEQGIERVLNKAESQYQQQQAQLAQLHQQRIDDLKQAHQQQIQQLQQQISDYQHQIAHQQQTIAQLNGRYDALLSCFVQQNNDIKDIDPSEFASNEPHEHDTDFAKVLANSLNDSSTSDATDTSNEQTEEENRALEDSEDAIDAESDSQKSEHNTTTVDPFSSTDALVDYAIQLRQDGDYDNALLHFQLAAEQQHPVAMGAIGRAYFKGEGVMVDPIKGLAWLIKAAERGLAPAIAKVQQYQQQQPELYRQAQQQASEL
jgi:TPR repeat protein